METYVKPTETLKVSLQRFYPKKSNILSDNYIMTHYAQVTHTPCSTGNLT